MTAQKSVIPMNEHGRAITQEDIKPTVLPDAYLTSSIASALVDFKMPRFEDLPTVGLYRDQVIGIVEQTYRYRRADAEPAWHLHRWRTPDAFYG